MIEHDINAFVRNMQIQRGNANPYANTQYVNHKNNTRQQHFNMQRKLIHQVHYAHNVPNAKKQNCWEHKQIQQDNARRKTVWKQAQRP